MPNLTEVFGKKDKHLRQMKHVIMSETDKNI